MTTQDLHFLVRIHAPKAKVWHAMLDDATYREWTSVFAEGSYYEGSWSKGASIKFLGPQGDGMLAEIAESKPNEFVSIRHLGVLTQGVPAAPGFEPAYENYTFTAKDGGTEVKVDLLHLPSEWVAMFQDLWPKALAKLKIVSER